MSRFEGSDSARVTLPRV